MKYQEIIAREIASKLDLELSLLLDCFETPPSSDLGDLALPCFRLAKLMRKAPAQIAEQIKAEIEFDFIEKMEVKAAYLNFFYARSQVASEFLNNIDLANWPKLEGHQDETILIEYSSPNIAKPFHVGHGFSTSLGEALAGIFEALNYRVLRLNYLGDYGTQFGKLIVAWQLYGDEAALAKNAITELVRIYVKFHSELENQPELEAKARLAFKHLEEGRAKEYELWQKFKDFSLAEFERIYQRLGISFDNMDGESHYSKQVEAVKARLEQAGILEDSEGAKVVFLDEYDLSPSLFEKSDGTSIYASRDLAAAYDRAKKYDFAKNIYVVGIPQKNHFDQLFAVLDKAGFAKAKDCVHVGFAHVKFSDGIFSTRLGNIITLEDFIDKTVAETKKIIAQNNPEMKSSEVDLTAEKVGLAAIKYTYLRNNRERDIYFSWEEMLDFDGDTAPYLLYTYARASSILRKFSFNSAEVNYSLLTSDEEWDLIKDLSLFAQNLELAAREYEPSILLRYVSILARHFNRYYHQTSIAKTEDLELRASRLALVNLVKETIKKALAICNIETVERM